MCMPLKLGYGNGLLDVCASVDFRKVSPFVTEGEWQESINLAYHPTISAIYSVLLTRSPAPATKQKHSPAFVLKTPPPLTAMQVILDIFQLICSHLGRASHKHCIYHIFHWPRTLGCFNPFSKPIAHNSIPKTGWVTVLLLSSVFSLNKSFSPFVFLHYSSL